MAEVTPKVMSPSLKDSPILDPSNRQMMDANAIQLQYDIPVFIFYFLFVFRYPSNFMGNGPLERAKYNSILLPERPTMQPYFIQQQPNLLPITTPELTSCDSRRFTGHQHPNNSRTNATMLSKTSSKETKDLSFYFCYIKLTNFI